MCRYHFLTHPVDNIRVKINGVGEEVETALENRGPTANAGQIVWGSGVDPLALHLFILLKNQHKVGNKHQKDIMSEIPPPRTLLCLQTRPAL